jgi:riboflavin kinase / FMN adenylyltransferase
MKVHHDLSQLPTFTNAVITIGTFDGVHLAHRQIIAQLISKAKSVNGESVLITFEPHPRMVLQPSDTSLKLLSTLSEKINLLSDLGIDHLVIAPFTTAFLKLTATEYIAHFLVKYFNPHTIIIGYDHQFGNNREGNFAVLKNFETQFNFQCVEIPKQLISEITISSSAIRRNLISGNIALANNLLSYSYPLSGTVVHGDARGRTIGYPTANIALHNSFKLIPANGVYAIRATLQGLVYGGMMNIGTRPTIEATKKVSLEAHLFNFDKQIYDEIISVSLVEKLRDELKFDGIQALITAIKQDEYDARNILNL